MSPAWTPDGRRIAYGVLTYSNAAQGVTRLQVRVVPAAASKAKGEIILDRAVAIPNSYSDLFTLDLSRF